jgi:hypothetical protein
MAVRLREEGGVGAERHSSIASTCLKVPVREGGLGRA